VNADLAYASGWDGTGIGVAVIDSGIHNFNDFKDLAGKNRIVYTKDYVGGGADDFYGHGTHAAGIVGSSGLGSTCSNCTRKFRGVAPNVNLINLRILNQNGAGSDSQVISAIQDAVSLKNTYSIRVINLSVGRGIYESYTQDPLCQAVESAWRAGIVVVVAAGNMGEYGWPTLDGYTTINAPGNDPYVITVGATNTHGTGLQTSQTVTSYSSKGPTEFDHIVKPDLVAPGNRVISDDNMAATLPKTYPSDIVALSYYQNTSVTTLSNQYYTLSGTSMAAPVVSGHKLGHGSFVQHRGGYLRRRRWSRRCIGRPREHGPCSSYIWFRQISHGPLRL
jgi:serine protease AprX